MTATAESRSSPCNRNPRVEETPGPERDSDENFAEDQQLCEKENRDHALRESEGAVGVKCDAIPQRDSVSHSELNLERAVSSRLITSGMLGEWKPTYTDIDYELLVDFVKVQARKYLIPKPLAYSSVMDGLVRLRTQVVKKDWRVWLHKSSERAQKFKVSRESGGTWFIPTKAQHEARLNSQRLTLLQNSQPILKNPGGARRPAKRRQPEELQHHCCSIGGTLSDSALSVTHSVPCKVAKPKDATLSISSSHTHGKPGFPKTVRYTDDVLVDDMGCRMMESLSTRSDPGIGCQTQASCGKGHAPHRFKSFSSGSSTTDLRPMSRTPSNLSLSSNHSRLSGVRPEDMTLNLNSGNDYVRP